MTFLRYSLLVRTDCEREFILLGYRMRLSRSEASLLCRLTEGTVDTDGLGLKMRRTTAAFVCSVNKKAFRISGRRLILFRDGGYRLNPYL